MKFALLLGTTLVLAPAIASPAFAAGCVKGAVVGGVLGHMSGHHGVAGAAAGCVIGHHQANERATNDRETRTNNAADGHR